MKISRFVCALIALATVSAAAISGSLAAERIMTSAEASLAEMDTAPEVIAADVTKNFDFKNFTGIDVSGIVQVELKKSNIWKVSVTLPADYEPYLSVRVSGSELLIGLKNMPDRITRRIKGGEVVASIEMPALYSLEMSGATKLYCEDFFDTGNRPFKMELSGAARVTRIDLSGSELDMELGGAANIRLTGTFDKAYIDAGGASRCDLDMDARIISEELSGAAKAYHTGDYGEIKVDASGASVFSVKGSAESLKLLGSGAVKLEAFDCVTDNAKVSMSGAGYCELNALHDVAVDLSGGSNLRYKDNPDVKVDVISISRAASIRKVK
ncbi:MAG: DUF2807 domain-containing protein [Bacteroidales bacterium]|nr:DUF2807 domain-containing protein [Bacteroidales bacterium]